MSAVYRIIQPELNPRTGLPFFLNFECRYPTIDLLAADLNDGAIVVGTKLITRKGDEPGLLEVVDRRPCAIAQAGVARIETPTVRFVEWVDDDEAERA